METLEIIAIDHGWSLIKTANTIFTAGVSQYATEPALTKNVIEYKEKFYVVGGQRLEVKDNKTQDENYYILTMAALAEELKIRGLRKARVVLVAGLPLTRFGMEKDGFYKYLFKNKDLYFKYENIPYQISLEKVELYPQSYAAIASKIQILKGNHLIADIGSWTIDIMPIQNSSPDSSKCKTIPRGLITCMREINEELVRRYNGEAPEAAIQEVMIHGTSDIHSKYLEVIQSECRKFAEKVIYTLKEIGYNLDLIHITFVGGGASVIKHFAPHNDNWTFIEDIKANAKGYEYLSKQMALYKKMEKNKR